MLVYFLPIILFFVVYEFYGIYAATASAIVMSVVQVGVHYYKTKSFDKMQVITLLLVAVLGGATLFLHNDIFIKWKPTLINWAFALVFLVTQLMGKKPLIQHLLEKEVKLPMPIWTRLNMAWIIFFIMIGLINIYVVYNFDTNTWVKFKLFGTLGLTLIFVIAQSFYLVRHIDPNELNKKS